ncbi:MAG TPA: hypothetical protein VF933_34305 [Streptosporangiaceae bacterium]
MTFPLSLLIVFSFQGFPFHLAARAASVMSARMATAGTAGGACVPGPGTAAGTAGRLARTRSQPATPRARITAVPAPPLPASAADRASS